MGEVFESLLWIVGVAFLAPLLSWVVPRRIVPETVLLLVGGFVIGPGVLGLATAGDSISFLRELGMAFLFLLAGYEIDVDELKGSGGRHAVVGWVLSLVLAFGAVALVGPPEGLFSTAGTALAIAMTSTALGTLLPILRERGMLATGVGGAVLNHGAVGEVGPIVLMALLLGSRSTWLSLAILLAFAAVTVLILRFTDRVKQVGRRLVEAVRLGGTTTAQTTIRLTVLLLVGLCTLAEVFELDVVLGAFAAGFIVRHALPEGNRQYEEKLDGLAYGFFIPVFFVTSGMAITVVFSTQTLLAIASFLGLLLVVRGVPVWLVSRAERRVDGSRVFSARQSTQVSLYATTALPIIVAVTQVAVGAGAMSRDIASNLIVAGALSVLVMPTLGLVFFRPADRAPASEAQGAPQGPVAPGGATAVPSSEGASPFSDGVRGLPSADSVVDRGRQEAHGARVDRARIVLGLDGLALADEEHRFLVDRLAQARVERTMWREQVRERSRQAARSRRGQDRGDSAKAGGRRRGRRRPR